MQSPSPPGAVADRPSAGALARSPWTLSAWHDLSIDQLYAHLMLRQRVFCVEQKCPYVDCDGLDPKALHLWRSDPTHGTIAYARLIPPGVKYAEASIGRVVTASAFRRTGLGRALVARAIDETTGAFGGAIKIQAQEYLLRFYESFGFVGVSDVFLEDGIPHVDMVRPAS